MIPRRLLTLCSLLSVLVLAGFAVAQIAVRNRDGSISYIDPDDEEYRPERYGVPDWEVKKHMPDDVFTFVRIRYHSDHSFGWRRRGGGWRRIIPSAI